HASEFTPLPTMIASCSATCELAKLVVRDEPALRRPKLVHSHKQVALFVVGEVEPELFRFDPDRVDPALLAEDDAPLGGDELGGVRLDRRRVMELAGHRARFAAEEVVADERLERLELVSRDFAE